MAVAATFPRFLIRIPSPEAKRASGGRQALGRRRGRRCRDAAGAEVLGVCLPEGIHSKAVIETFLDFAKRNRDDIKYNPSFVIYWAMLEKYACKR